jgi:hypothetical protein
MGFSLQQKRPETALAMNLMTWSMKRYSPQQKVRHRKGNVIASKSAQTVIHTRLSLDLVIYNFLPRNATTKLRCAQARLILNLQVNNEMLQT